MVKKAVTSKKKKEKTVTSINAPKKYEEINFVDTSKSVWNYSLLPKKIL